MRETIEVSYLKRNQSSNQRILVFFIFFVFFVFIKSKYVGSGPNKKEYWLDILFETILDMITYTGHRVVGLPITIDLALLGWYVLNHLGFFSTPLNIVFGTFGPTKFIIFWKNNRYFNCKHTPKLPKTK